MAKELNAIREKLGGDPLFPKPRYSVDECLLLLGEGRKRFYSKIRSGRYSITKDGGRTYMTHAQLLDAAEGDTQVAARANAFDQFEEQAA